MTWLPPMQELLIEKHPFERLMPFANVEVAVAEVTFKALAWSPANVDVADPPEVMLIEPSVLDIPLLVRNIEPVPT